MKIKSLLLALFLSSSILCAEPYLGVEALFVSPSSDNRASGEAIGGSGFDDGMGFGAKAGFRLVDNFALELQLLYFKTDETANLDTDFGTFSGKQELTMGTGFLNALLDLAAMRGPFPWFLEIGGGIGLAVLHNDVSVSGPGFSDSGSDVDTAFAWQVVGNLGYRVTDWLALGFTARYMNFGDAKWGDRDIIVEAENLSATAFGAFALVEF